MKLIPTAPQTVGPFFSIGLTPLYQNDSPEKAAGEVRVSGTVFDGDGKPIPDAVLEFWSANGFARVPTSDNGAFLVNLIRIAAQSEQNGGNAGDFFEVLIFMRGLLKPVYTRVYLAEVNAFKNDPELKAVPADRIATLAAQPASMPNRYIWNIFMQGENETVFFEF
jgi:protocatechuate 3,4-dioxygenase alpha subunit